MERRGEGESRTKGELIRQIYWAADRRQVEIGEYEERTRFENPCQTFDTENSRHGEPTESHRAASWHSWFMIITRRCQLFEECVHRCRSADRRMPGIVPLLRPALMIRGIEPASEKNPPRTAMSSFFPTLPRVPPLPFPSYSFLPPRSINRPVFHSSPRCFDFEAYSRFRGRLEFRCFSKMEYLDGHFRRSSVAS